MGYSPERQDPGNLNFSTSNIPKVVAGDGEKALKIMKTFYGRIIDGVVPVSTTRIAEAAKITENVFRSVNIALINELKVVFDRMGIDIWEVIRAAKSKPFSFMPFYPGPGLGGHCIPIDPFYLSWKAHEYKADIRFIELAGEINTSMPDYVVHKLKGALADHSNKPLASAKILVIGIAYKKNISDIRESPSLRILELLQNQGAEFFYHDPHVPGIPKTRKHPHLFRMESVKPTKDTLQKIDAVVIATDHDRVDYKIIAKHAKLIIDTRNVMERNGFTGSHIVKA